MLKLNLKKLIDARAVGESFGYYFDEDGEIVQKAPIFGIQL